MNKQFVLIVILLTLFLSAGMGAYYVWDKRNEESENGKYMPGTTAEQQLSSPSRSNQNQPANQGGLKVMGATGQNSSNSIPGPENFEQYEQYANNQNTVFIDVQVGTGNAAKTGDNVSMVYKGWLTNGELFDESRKNELGQTEALTFALGSGQVIQGWEQGIVGMKEGGKRRLIIPASAGYGEMGQGPIPPNSMLIFDVELVQVQAGG